MNFDKIIDIELPPIPVGVVRVTEDGEIRMTEDGEVRRTETNQ